MNALWGPHAVAFDRLRGKTFPKFSTGPEPVSHLWLANAAGTGVHRLTHVAPQPLSFGLVPLFWSANGRRLLAAYSGQDRFQAWMVNVLTGAAAQVGAGQYAPAGLSRNGRFMLGLSGGSEGGGTPVPVVRVDLRTGHVKVLRSRAVDPNWNA